jgi:ceramide glucosyltransferase
MNVSGAVAAFAFVCGAFAAAGSLYLLVSGWMVLRFRRSAPPPLRPIPVTVLVPLCGKEPGLAERLLRLRNQIYPAPVQIVCGVSEATDPALADICRAAAGAGRWPIDLHCDARQHGRNRKVSNLANMMDCARHDILVMLDSDMEVGPDYLVQVVTELQRPGTGAVTCLYRARGEGGIAAELAAMAINLHFLPNAVVGLAAGLARPCFGATIALSRAMLLRIGGLKAFADQLWDDYAIGQAVRAQGQAVGVSGFAPVHVCAEPSLRALFMKEVRAARTIRGIDPAGHLRAVLTHPLPFAVIALLAAQAWWSWWLLIAALGSRFFLARAVEHRFDAPAAPFVWMPVCDLISFAAYAASWRSATVSWRGQTYRVDADGELSPTTNRG